MIVTKMDFLYLALFFVLFSLWSFYLVTHPFRIKSDNVPANYGVNYEKISFQTSDNITIRGWFIPNKNSHAKTIIVLHGYPADMGDILPARMFLHKDYNLLFFNFRYLGTSGGDYSTVGKDEVLDLLAAIKYLHTRGINNVAVWGFSMGGAVALLTTQQTSAIKALIVESAYARLDWMAAEYYKIPLLRYPLAQMLRLWSWVFLGYDLDDVDPYKVASKLDIPILFIHSKKDRVISFRHAKLLQDSSKQNSKAEYIFTDGLMHGQPFPNYQESIGNFLKHNIKW